MHITKMQGMKDYLDVFLEEYTQDESNYTSIEWLDDNRVNFDFSPLPLIDNGVVSRDVLGNETKYYTVMYSAVFDYSQDIAQALENGNYFEELEYWIKENNRKKIFPKMSNDRKPIIVDIVQSPYLFMATPDNQKAQYTITLNLVYIQYNRERTDK